MGTEPGPPPCSNYSLCTLHRIEEVFNQGTIIPRRAIEPFYQIISGPSFPFFGRNVNGRSSNNEENTFSRRGFVRSNIQECARERNRYRCKGWNSRVEREEYLTKEAIFSTGKAYQLRILSDTLLPEFLINNYYRLLIIIIKQLEPLLRLPNGSQNFQEFQEFSISNKHSNDSKSLSDWIFRKFATENPWIPIGIRAHSLPSCDQDSNLL